jgi:hypothetical protein
MWGTLDLAGSYRAVFREALPNAVLVADPFHLIKLASTSLDETRRRVQRTYPWPQRQGRGSPVGVSGDFSIWPRRNSPRTGNAKATRENPLAPLAHLWVVWLRALGVSTTIWPITSGTHNNLPIPGQSYCRITVDFRSPYLLPGP